MNWDSTAAEKKNATQSTTQGAAQTAIEPALWEQAHQLLRSTHHPLLLCHVAPDGDAVGSLVGLGRALRHLGLEPILACADPIFPHFAYIPGAEAVTQDVEEPFDLVIALDCSDLDRLGDLARRPAFDRVPLLNVDHHLTNLRFGTVNLVDPRASSTAEIVLQLLDHIAAPLDAEAATALLAGIVTDTRGFRTDNVTTSVVEAALRLMQAGASLHYVTYHGLDRRATAAIRLWGAAISQLQVEDRVVWTSIPLSIRHAVGYTGSGDASLASFLIGAEDADAAVVFVEEENGHVDVGLRAVPGFDVAQVALNFGGGGHALAAGCDLPGPLEEAQASLLAALKADLARQRARET